MFLVDVLCFISSLVYLKFFVFIVIFRGENFLVLCMFMVVVFLMSILVYFVRFLVIVLWSGNIFFVVSDCKLVLLIFINLKSLGSFLLLSFVLWSSIFGYDDFWLCILLILICLLSVFDILVLFVFLRGSLVLFFNCFLGLLSFVDLFFFCVFCRGIIFGICFIVVFLLMFLKFVLKL